MTSEAGLEQGRGGPAGRPKPTRLAFDSCLNFTDCFEITTAAQDEMVIDRQLQRQMLELMSEHYPNSVCVFHAIDAPHETIIRNLFYLQEHRLCDAQLHGSVGGGWSFGEQQITAAGLDFLADDGGLTAVLNVMTIKFEAETMRAMLVAKANASTLPAEEKSLLKRQLSSLPEAALKAATERLLQVGLDQMPNAIHWLGTLVGH